MFVRVITLRYHDGLQGFPEQLVREASAGREILEVRDHFFMHGNVPHIAMVLMLADNATGEKPAWNRAASSTPDPAKELPDRLQKLYRDLREWRNDRAKKDGVPSYVIMRNTLLAEICRRLPQSLAQLREIDGIGEATAARYGADILGLVSAFAATNPGGNPPLAGPSVVGNDRPGNPGSPESKQSVSPAA